MAKPNTILTTLLLALFGASNVAWADEPAFKDLPGVTPPGIGSDTQSGTANCTSHIQRMYDAAGRRWIPQRIYTCEDGDITYWSNKPPLDQQQAPDPYVYGTRP